MDWVVGFRTVRLRKLQGIQLQVFPFTENSGGRYQTLGMSRALSCCDADSFYLIIKKKKANRIFKDMWPLLFKRPRSLIKKRPGVLAMAVHVSHCTFPASWKASLISAPAAEWSEHDIKYSNEKDEGM